MAHDGSQGAQTKLPRNAVLAATTFLSGTNAAYLEQQYAKYAKNPALVDPELKVFFDGLGDDAEQVAQNAEGPSWERDDWPTRQADELTAALDGNWSMLDGALEQKVAAKNRVRRPKMCGRRQRIPSKR